LLIKHFSFCQVIFQLLYYCPLAISAEARLLVVAWTTFRQFKLNRRFGCESNVTGAELSLVGRKNDSRGNKFSDRLGNFYFIDFARRLHGLESDKVAF